MSPQQARKSRNEEIPGNFILNWQCPGAGGARQVVRRPMTACEACRIAKVKCKGQQEQCDRCTSRGIRCKYTAPSQGAAGAGTASTSSTSASTTTSTPPATDVDRPSPSKDQHTTTSSREPRLPLGTIPMDWDIGAADPFYMNDEGYQNSHRGMVDWPKEVPTEMFDWPSALDFDHNIINPTAFDDLDLFQSPIPQVHGLATQGSSPSIPPASPSDFSGISLPSPGSCGCRGNLMLRIPDVKSAMQEKPHPQLDRVFKVTGNVLRTCRDIINCGSCQVTYTDLVCVMAVLQQTEVCFAYIASEDRHNSAIKVSVGDYEVSIANEVKLRHMLVLDLVTQANSLLSVLRSLSENLALSQPVNPDRFAQINLVYLQEVVENFGTALRSITDSLSKRGSETGLVR